MEDFEIFQRMGLAIAIGAAVGVERHWREKDEDDGRRTAGIRTFTLIGMLGGAAGLIEHSRQSRRLGSHERHRISDHTDSRLRSVSVAGAIAEKNFSVTSVVAAMLTFAFAVIAVLGDMTVASAGSAPCRCACEPRISACGDAQTSLDGTAFSGDSSRPDACHPSHCTIRTNRTIWRRFAVRILTMVIALAAISFCGYAAVRVLGSAKGELSEEPLEG